MHLPQGARQVKGISRPAGPSVRAEAVLLPLITEAPSTPLSPSPPSPLPRPHPPSPLPSPLPPSVPSSPPPLPPPLEASPRPQQPAPPPPPALQSLAALEANSDAVAAEAEFKAQATVTADGKVTAPVKLSAVGRMREKQANEAAARGADGDDKLVDFLNNAFNRFLG